MKGNKLLMLIGCIALPLILGSIAGFATSTNISQWYIFLEKPSFNPPNWLFGPVWTLLYILMGISHYMILSREPSALRSRANVIYFIQLALNFAWSFIFFYFHQVGWALLEISILWMTIILMISTFLKIDRRATYLQILYLCWVTFATILNASIWHLNK